MSAKTTFQLLPTPYKLTADKIVGQFLLTQRLFKFIAYRQNGIQQVLPVAIGQRLI